MVAFKLLIIQYHRYVTMDGINVTLMMQLMPVTLQTLLGLVRKGRIWLCYNSGHLAILPVCGLLIVTSCLFWPLG